MIGVEMIGVEMIRGRNDPGLNHYGVETLRGWIDRGWFVTGRSEWVEVIGDESIHNHLEHLNFRSTNLNVYLHQERLVGVKTVARGVFSLPTPVCGKAISEIADLVSLRCGSQTPCVLSDTSCFPLSWTTLTSIMSEDQSISPPNLGGKTNLITTEGPVSSTSSPSSLAFAGAVSLNSPDDQNKPKEVTVLGIWIEYLSIHLHFCFANVWYLNFRF